MSDEEKLESSKAPENWDCEIPSYEAKEGWTVGAKHSLACRGDYLEKLTPPIKIEVIPPPKKENKDPNMKKQTEGNDPQLDYALYVLDTKQIDNKSADFIITSYKPGKYQDVSIKLVDKDENEILINPMSWEVTSLVTKENQNGFGPTGPLKLPMPWWYWMALLSVILIASLVVVGKIWLINKVKKQLKKIKSHATALGPVNQFYKDIRLLKSKYEATDIQLSVEKLNEYWKDLEGKFDLFLIRQYEIPVSSWSRAKTLKAINKKLGHLSSLKLNNQLKRILTEFKKGSAVDNITMDDIKQMEALSQKYVEAIKKINKKGGQ